MMKKKFHLLMVLGFTLMALAQNGTVKGKIIGADNKSAKDVTVKDHESIGIYFATFLPTL